MRQLPSGPQQSPPAGRHVDVEGIPARVRGFNDAELLTLLRLVINTSITGPPILRDLITGRTEQANGVTAALLSAMPAATDEVLALLAAPVEPLDPADAQRLADAMVNPDPGVVLDVVGAVLLANRHGCEPFGDRLTRVARAARDAGLIGPALN